jgi:hypothetical protein
MMFLNGSGYLEQPVSDFEGLLIDDLKYIPEEVYNPVDNPEVYPEGIPIMKVIAPTIIDDTFKPVMVRFEQPEETTVYHHIPESPVDTIVESGTDVQKTPMEQFLSLIPLSGLALFAFAL